MLHLHKVHTSSWKYNHDEKRYKEKRIRGLSMNLDSKIKISYQQINLRYSFFLFKH